MIGLPLKKLLNLFYVSVLNFSDIKVDAKGIILLFYCLNKRELILLDILNKLDSTHNQNLKSLIQNNNFISITNLLFNPQKLQE